MDIKKIRQDFPVFAPASQKSDLIYLDSAATSQKPQVVIDAVSRFYSNGSANIHRAVYDLGEQVTSQYNLVREKIAKFINAQECETIFTSGTTEGINFIASTWGRKFIQPGDEIIVSIMEHHANFIPWQQLASSVGATLKVIDLTPDYQLDIDQYQRLLTPKTKLVAITQASNVLGGISNLDLIINQAKHMGSAVLIDAAQSAAYVPIDVKKLNCDFLVFSGHKMLAPNGIGILYLAQKWHEQILPYQFGGGMVADVTVAKSTFLQAPEKFEAGTMPLASIMGLGAAVDYLQTKTSKEQLHHYLASLSERLVIGLQQIPAINIIGNLTQLKQSSLVSFTVTGYHAHDIAAYLNQFNICVRAGHHCAQPLHHYLGLPATVRVSFQIYNQPQEVDLLLLKLAQLVRQGL